MIVKMLFISLLCISCSYQEVDRNKKINDSITKAAFNDSVGAEYVTITRYFDKGRMCEGKLKLDSLYKAVRQNKQLDTLTKQYLDAGVYTINTYFKNGGGCISADTISKSSITKFSLTIPVRKL